MSLFLGLTKLVLIKRGGEPYKGQLALPGGFVNEGETVESALLRETREELGIDLSDVPLHNLGAFSEPGRDPRGWTITCGFCVIPRSQNKQLQIVETLKARDDAAEIVLENIGYPLGSKIPKLAFDHNQIVAKSYQLLEAGK